jgi:hypothetical protein
MAEPLDRRSMHSRKPTVHFDDKIAQSLVSAKPAKPTKPAKSTKPTKLAQKSKKPPTLPTQASLAECDDVVTVRAGMSRDVSITGPGTVRAGLGQLGIGGDAM